jgi:thioesterase domain-containing protein
MHPDLETIIAADEEARARVSLAEERRGRELAAAGAAGDADIERRRAAAREALDRELDAIARDGEARLAALREQQQAYLLRLAAAGDARFAEAVAIYRRTVVEGR